MSAEIRARVGPAQDFALRRPRMQRVDFYQLERPIQERFVASARGTAPPAPLASHRDLVPREVLVWGAVALASFAGVVVLGTVGYGELASNFGVQPQWVLSVYAVLGVLVVFAGLRAFALLRHVQSPPFAPAVYLFPSGLVDTRGREFVVRPLSELRGVAASGRSLTLNFTDGFSFTFRVADAARAEQLKRLLGEYGERFNPDAAPVSAREVAAFDPLKDNGFSNPFSPTEPMRRPKLGLRFVAPLVAILLGPLLGYAAFALRNFMGEEALYREARAVDTRDAYQVYVARGGKRSEIREILLPRAELAAIVERGDLPELESYALKRKNSAIWPEIEAALGRALLAELERVKGVGTRAALREFQTRYERHALLAPSIARAVSDHRARVLTKFAAVAKPSPEVLDLFRRLLTYADEHGPRVELRYRRKMADSVPRTEMQLRKSIFFGGEASLPKQYFDAKHSEKREAELTKTLVEHFSRAFPADMLVLEPSAPLDEPSEELPKVSAPTLLVSHRTEMSGAYLSTQPRAAYTGIGLLFRVSLQIPDDPNAHVYKYSTWHAPALREIRNGASFESIYGEMGEKAFAKLTKRYVTELLPGFAE